MKPLTEAQWQRKVRAKAQLQRYIAEAAYHDAKCEVDHGDVTDTRRCVRLPR